MESDRFAHASSANVINTLNPIVIDVLIYDIKLSMVYKKFHLVLRHDY
jgi:hypothetical protein